MNAVVSPLVRGALGPRVRPQGITKAAVEKTLLASSTAAYLPVQEADVLIDYVTNESKLLRESNVLKMDKNTRNLDSLDISTGVLRKATEGTCPDTAEVTTERKQIVTQEMIATLPISDSWVEDNVEGEAGADRAVRMLVDQLANDAEIISLMASLPANVFWDDAGQDTTTMRMWNGWYALMRLNASVLDATEDTEAEGRGISICKLKKLVQCLATKYRRRKEDLRIYMSENLHLDLVKIKMDRETPLGDRLLIEGLDWEADKFAGIPIVPIPLIPENVDS